MAGVLLNANGIIEESRTEEPPKVDHSTHKAAFMVLISEDGTYTLEPDINKPVIPERKPNTPEMKGAMATLLMDMQTQETAILAANHTLSAQMQMARQMADAKASQDIAQLLSKGNK